MPVHRPLEQKQNQSAIHLREAEDSAWEPNQVGSDCQTLGRVFRHEEQYVPTFKTAGTH